MLKLQGILADGTVGSSVMNSMPCEAEEMREQMLAFDCVAEVVVVDDPGWASL
jgi:hypothetical protein